MKICVIGSNGYWGQNHVRTLKTMGVDVLTCDVIGQAVYKDYLDIKKVDGVVIATQPEYHADIAFYFMINKIPVLIEKPMVVSSEESSVLMKVFGECNEPTVIVGHTYLYSPAVQYIKKFIESGELGALYYISCDWKNLGLFQKSGVIWDLAPHPLSIILYLTGANSFNIQPLISHHVVDGVPDVAVVRLGLEECDAYINLSWIDPKKTRQITVVGSKKMIIFDDTEPLEKIRVYDKSCVFHDKSDSFGTWNMSYKYGDTLIPKIENKEPLKEELDDLLWCIRDRKRAPKSDIQLGARVVQIIERIHKSAG